jgi:hypothetical protein
MSLRVFTGKDRQKDGGQGEVPRLNAALAGLLHHVAAHVAGSTGTDAERFNNDALLKAMLFGDQRDAASDLLATQHFISESDGVDRLRPRPPTEEMTRRAQWTGAASA